MSVEAHSSSAEKVPEKYDYVLPNNASGMLTNVWPS